MIKLRLSWLVAGAIIVAAFLAIQPAAAQSMMNGYWNPLGHQDSYNYGGGPDPGDFSGLPITDEQALSLVKSGFTNLEGLRDAAVEDLVEILSVDEAKAKEIHDAVHQETPAAQ